MSGLGMILRHLAGKGMESLRRLVRSLAEPA